MFVIRNAQLQALAATARSRTVDKFVAVSVDHSLQRISTLGEPITSATSGMDLATWRRAVINAEQEAWDLGLRQSTVLDAYIGTRLICGPRPWPEAIERWLRPGEAAEASRLQCFAAAACLRFSIPLDE
jgi:hypothetical protein